MKIRKGFVSNSSSSSFVCCITGATEGGYDVSLYDCGMVECEKGHTFIYHNYPEVVDWCDSNDNHYGYGISEEVCPVCNGKAKPEIVARIKNELKSLNISVEDLK